MSKFWGLYVLVALAFVGGACFFVFNKTADPNNPPPSPPPGTSISYVSLGDSIPEGYALPQHSNKDLNGFVAGSYPYSIRSFLQNSYANVSAINYAKEGLTSTQLKTQLVNLSKTTLTSEQQEMKTNIANADVITICIGANDILGPAQKNLLDIVRNSDFSQYLKDFDNGVNLFSNNLSIIVDQLNILNPTAKLIFSNIYNPYKEFLTAKNGVSVYYSTINLMDVSAKKVNIIGQISEAYIDGDIIYNESDEIVKTVEVGLNQIINNTIQDKENCYLIDVKAEFDAYLTNNSSYGIVQATILQYTKINVVFSNPFNTEQSAVELQQQLTPYIDPHPTLLGHHIITNLITAKITNLFQNTQQTIVCKQT